VKRPTRLASSRRARLRARHRASPCAPPFATSDRRRHPNPRPGARAADEARPRPLASRRCRRQPGKCRTSRAAPLRRRASSRASKASPLPNPSAPNGPTNRCVPAVRAARPPPPAKRPSIGRAQRCAFRTIDRPKQSHGHRDNAPSTASRPSKGASPGVLTAQCVRLCAFRTRLRCFVFLDSRTAHLGHLGHRRALQGLSNALDHRRDLLRTDEAHIATTERTKRSPSTFSRRRMSWALHASCASAGTKPGTSWRRRSNAGNRPRASASPPGSGWTRRLPPRA